MRTVSRAAVVALLLIGCVGCDQTTKAIVQASLPTGQGYEYLGGAFRIQHAENVGAFLSVGASLPRGVRDVAFTLGVGAVVGALLLWVSLGRDLSTIRRLSLTAIAAGGIGNVIDRVLHDGAVTDFLYLGIGVVHTGVFNLADVTLVLGLTGMLLERPLCALAGNRWRGP